MLEPLSEPIRRLLFELRLCSLRDLRRCRRLVRAMTHDLPAFDSVWLDALVQIGRLTPDQARILESRDPAAIRIGPCVAVKPIGGGSFGRTLLARPAEGGELCVIKQLNASDRLTAETVERLEEFIDAVRGFDHPALVAPKSCFRVDHQIVLVSRYVAGPHLGELVVRRGRFPAAVAWEIGRQLAEGLDRLAQRGLTHGDIRAANVRLTLAGAAVLVDAGIRQALDPVLTMHSGLAPERYDGVAPELIGVGGQPCVATDAYALGCLLWQLLAGRPPFPGGDPLIKLAAHQTRTIDDVRRWAPDTPDLLARGIARMTSRKPADRPQRFSELLEYWGPPSRAGRRRLAQFRRRFDAPARSVSERRSLSAPTRWLFVAATLFAVSGGIATLVHEGARNVALAWASGISQKLRQSESIESAGVERRAHNPGASAAADSDEALSLLPLPQPDRHGNINLESAGPYRASDINVVGELTIAGGEAASATIIVDDQPFKLCAETVRMKNVRIVTSSRAARRAVDLRALVRIESQGLMVERCVFDSGDSRDKTHDSFPPGFAPPTGPALIAWKLLDTADQRGGTGMIRDSLLFGDGPAVYLAHAVRQLTCDNVLKSGPGPLVQLAAAPAAKSKTVLKLSHSTTRAAGAIIRWVVPGEEALKSGSPARLRGSIMIEASDCVFDVASPRAALVELAGTGSEPRPEWLQAVQMTGEGSVTRPSVETAAWVSTADGRLTPLEGTALSLEGLVAGDFHFTGASATRVVDCEVHDSETPRRSPHPPGIRAGESPR
ncbi:MAG: serine/threonine protein kinase [Planctomycetia bacterium]|nr:serine/threonine protein kinase [Planctomycetia bacterium]